MTPKKPIAKNAPPMDNATLKEMFFHVNEILGDLRYLARGPRRSDDNMQDLGSIAHWLDQFEDAAQYHWSYHRQQLRQLLSSPALLLHCLDAEDGGLRFMAARHAADIQSDELARAIQEKIEAEPSLQVKAHFAVALVKNGLSEHLGVIGECAAKAGDKETAGRILDLYMDIADAGNVAQIKRELERLVGKRRYLTEMAAALIAELKETFPNV